MITLISFGTDILRMFIDDVSVDEWEDIATSWVLVAFVTAVLFALLTFAFKGIRKSMAKTGKEEVWERTQTWRMICYGIVPLFFALLIYWYAERDFFNYVRLKGFLIGTVFAWFLYVFFMVIGHLFSKWRREIF